MKNEANRTRKWRLRHDLSVRDLAALTGYSAQTIWAYERGFFPSSTRYPERPVPAWAWQRWRMVCAGVEAQLKSGRIFEW